MLVVASVLTTSAYEWIKLLVPAMNPRLWDSTFAGWDRALCLGVDPNVFLLTIAGGLAWLTAVGAVASGWHYLVDVIAGALLGVVVWKVADCVATAAAATRPSIDSSE